jgi:isopentenyl phosphate kinase
MIFLKLGGSLLTDKTATEVVRDDVVQRLAAEIAAALQASEGTRLVIGHGSGSFGHVAAARHGTRSGVGTPAQWHGFADVADAAARLNRRVVGALLAEGVPALALPPSALALAEGGQMRRWFGLALSRACDAGLVPVVYGDVAFDTALGGTIVSTEEVLSFLATTLRPTRLLLAGEVPGVLDDSGAVVARITPQNFAAVARALGGSRGTDVTGGMATKVRQMLALVQGTPALTVRIFSGLEPDLLRSALRDETDAGTVIAAH